jgi:diguanylate cyclase (GGDEF)-like protein
VAAGTSIDHELLLRKKSGELIWVRTIISPIRGPSGDVSGFIGVGFDSTALHNLSESDPPNLPFHIILAEIPGFIYRSILRSDGRFETVYLSPSASQFLGDSINFDPGLLTRQIHPDDRHGWDAAIQDSAKTLGPFSAEVRLVLPAGGVRWIRTASRPVRHANGDLIWDGLALDITAEKASDLERSYLSHHDKLTGLANRDLFRTRLRQAIDRIALDETTIGVFCLDLDDFKEVNDSCGVAAGDEVLRQTARRLSAFAEAAGGSVARLGADEFAVLMPLTGPPWAVETIARSLCETVVEPLDIQGQDLVVHGSVGAALFPSPDPAQQTVASDVGEELMKRVDLALHAAKQEEPGGFRVYEANLDHRLRHRVALRQSLTRAIADEQFELHYQPIVNLDTGIIAGAEALVRWNHPQLGLQRPDAFIPLAESSGLIVPLGAWVMKQALRQGSHWRRTGLTVGAVAINLSGAQLRRGLHSPGPDFLAVVEAPLVETGADPTGYEFELTESTLIDSSDETLTILRGLKAMGFRIAIDDFGTGHASFRYLRDLVFDKVKIDRSFVSRIGEDAESESIVAAMIRLPRLLGATVVAEGVESAAQRDFLFEHGCEFGQGYLFSPPVRAEDFGWMLGQAFVLPVRRGRSAPLSVAAARGA